jgi:hypothetical protein
MLVCIFHFAEHVVQIVQIYVLNMKLHESKGILGLYWPWLVHSEVLHYGYALFMLIGLWHFRTRFSGISYTFWMTAFFVQFWHHFEHVLLLAQATTGVNLFGAPQPISVIQFVGFLNGPAETGFGGILTMSHFGECTCQGAVSGTKHVFTPMLLLVRRPEVHLIYNLLVMTPIVGAMVTKK